LGKSINFDNSKNDFPYAEGTMLNSNSNQQTQENLRMTLNQINMTDTEDNKVIDAFN
jgi:hypothetical protein